MPLKPRSSLSEPTAPVFVVIGGSGRGLLGRRVSPGEAFERRLPDFLQPIYHLEARVLALRSRMQGRVR